MTLARRWWGAAGGGVATYGPYPSVSSWTITKASNPVITIPAGETTEQYNPGSIRLPNGDIWTYVKGASRIYAWKSTDGGASYTIQNGGSPVIVPGSGTAWDHSFALEPTVLYDAPTDTVHLYYKGYPGVGGTGWSWGHATGTGAHPETLTKDPTNPILQGEDVAVALGGAGPVADMAVSSVIKIGSSFYFYGYIMYNGVVYLSYTTGTTFNTPTAGAFTLIPRFGSDIVYETPSVIGAPDGSYLMLYASGGLQPDPRSVFTATSPDGLTWTDHSASGAVCAPASGWEALEAYSGQFVRSNYAPYTTPYVNPSGQWLYLYSGLSAAHVATSGVAYIVP